MLTLSIAFFAALIIGSAIAHRLMRKPSHEPFTGEHVGSEYVTVRIGYRTPAEHAAGMQ
jgi:hypothetical protein